MDPSILFTNDGYLQTGTYFFRDLDMWKFCYLHENDNKFHSIKFYNERRNFILSLLPIKTDLFPSEWGILI